MMLLGAGLQRHRTRESAWEVERLASGIGRLKAYVCAPRALKMSASWRAMYNQQHWGGEKSKRYSGQELVPQTYGRGLCGD